MLIRGTPKDINKYIAVTPLTSTVLHMANFIPCYMDTDYVYYEKTNKLIEFMQKEGLQCQN